MRRRLHIGDHQLVGLAPRRFQPGNQVRQMRTTPADEREDADAHEARFRTAASDSNCSAAARKYATPSITPRA